jgi:hypothetical protein
MTIKENVLSGLKLAQIKIENADEVIRELLKKEQAFGTRLRIV